MAGGLRHLLSENASEDENVESITPLSQGKAPESPAKEDDAEESGKEERGAAAGEDSEEAEAAKIGQVEDLTTERVCSIMTLGSVAFQMGLIYLVNARDQDMRRYAYRAIGQTISIFCAVLIFSAACGTVETRIYSLDKVTQAFIYPLLALGLYTVMQFIVTHSVLSHGALSRMHATANGQKLKVTASILNAKTFGAGMAQICATAWIHGFGLLQFRAYTDLDSIPLTAAVIPFAFVVFVVLVKVSAFFRRLFVARLPEQHVEAELNWAEITEDCEDEMVSITLGFLMSVFTRAVISDTFPPILTEGLRERVDLTRATAHQVSLMESFGVLCAVLGGAIIHCTWGSQGRRPSPETLESSTCSRMVRMVILTLCCAWAWTIGFGLHLISEHFRIFSGLRLRILLATFTSFASFLVISALDWLADLSCTGPAVDKVLVTLIDALGICIGLSWENAFHESVTVLVEFMVMEDSVLVQVTDDPTVWSLSLSAITVLVVFPAYRMYIVPTMYQLLEEHDTKMNALEDGLTWQSIPSEAGDKPLVEHTFMFCELPICATD